MSGRWRARIGLLGCVTALALLPAGAANAHPLGNFTVNHYDGLVLTSHAVRDSAVVDAAEIPTQQALHSVDVDRSGSVSEAERSAYALRTCTGLASALDLTVDGRPSSWHVDSSSFAYRPGAAGLPTSRVECGLTAPADFSKNADVRFADTFDADRIGWHEITARPEGTHLVASPVPAASITDELRHYPNDLLSSPLDVKRVVVHVEPGTGRSTVASGAGRLPGAGPVSRLVEPLNRFFAGLAGARHLTAGVGMLAVLVSLLLGASHAALPGHGKTVMAAYLAGKRGSVRDAVVVGATVTITHTVGVLLLGLALTASSSLAGEKVTGDLGVASGALVAVIGLGLLMTALRRIKPNAHDHHHEHEHPEGHEHVHHHDHARPRRRLGLVGMGVAGGLVPSPSALVVLLGAVALGRTWFGVLLVLGYGVGMAATLTAAGLLLVRLSSRWAGRFAGRLGGRLSTATPIMTAGLVVVVGLGLAARSLATV